MTYAPTHTRTQAYRRLARVRHPDKGGSATDFAALRHAFEVLSDAKRRAAYDDWASQLRWRGGAPRGPAAAAAGLGGESVLLDEFASLGLRCDARTQLVVTCEVCRRPATKRCWTCGADICEFCTLKRHWRDGFGLHWPLINSDHLRERLARRELERKRLDDERAARLELPNFRSERELRDARAFKAAARAARLAGGADPRGRAPGPDLLRFYMWAQTSDRVFVAARVPTGYEDRELAVEATPAGLLVQSEEAPALIDRDWAHALDARAPVEVFRTQDNRVCAIMVHKAAPGERWRRLFRGDSDGLRCLEPPYRLDEGVDDVVMELTLPFWIERGDVGVAFAEHGVDVVVRNTLHVARTFWRNEEEAARRPDYRAVDVDDCLWSLDEEEVDGEEVRILMLTLAKPPLTQDEELWKKGRRQDNLAAERPGTQKVGYRFFLEDEDEFALEDLLQALCFAEQGATYAPAKPWEPGSRAAWVRDERLLSPAVRVILANLPKRVPAPRVEELSD